MLVPLKPDAVRIQEEELGWSGMCDTSQRDRWRTREERRRGEERRQCGKNEARFCHRVFAAVSLGIPNGDILILNFRRGETKNGGLRHRPYVKQEIGGGGVPRIGRQFVFEFS